MERLQIIFTTESPDIDEQSLPEESIQDYVLRLAESKARHIAAKYTDAIVIGSDQALECEGKILGKPGDHKMAKQQLTAMSSKTLSFFTGLCVINARTKNTQKEVVIYRVKFRNLKESEIEAYLLKEQPYNCAGSFMSEKLGVSLIERMEGDDPSALIGLPLISLCNMLRQQGVTLP